MALAMPSTVIACNRTDIRLVSAAGFGLEEGASELACARMHVHGIASCAADQSEGATVSSYLVVTKMTRCQLVPPPLPKVTDPRLTLSPNSGPWCPLMHKAQTGQF